MLDLTRRPTALLTGTSSDAHTWNLVLLRLLLAEQDFQVVGLGPCPPDDLVLAECLRAAPDLVVVSSVNGHGHADGARLIRALRAEPALAEVPVVIGGKLGVNGSAAGRAAGLRAAGYTEVYDDDGIEDFLRFLDTVATGVRT
jgi:methylaspartate mutase sigma subunit